MATASKQDIQHMSAKQRNRYRREGLTWAEIKKIDQAIGRGDRQVTLKLSTGGEMTITW